VKPHFEAKVFLFCLFLFLNFLADSALGPLYFQRESVCRGDVLSAAGAVGRGKVVSFLMNYGRLFSIFASPKPRSTILLLRVRIDPGWFLRECLSIN